MRNKLVFVDVAPKAHFCIFYIVRGFINASALHENVHLVTASLRA